MRAVRAGIAVVLILASAGAVLGVGDLAENAVSFSGLEGLQTTLLWLTIAFIAAIPAGFVAAGLCLALPRRSAAGIAAFVAWIVLQGGLLAATKASWFGIPVAIVVSIALLAAAWWLARRSDPLAGVGWRCSLVLVSSLLVSMVLVSYRPSYPGGWGGSDSGQTQPHVVVIVLDTLRADHLGAYGDTRGLSPGFDAIARQGTIFEDAYVNAPWTVPSHASLFSGLPARAHGATTLHHRWLDDRFTTIAEALKAQGYGTAMFSANRYLREANLAQGFDSYRPLGERFEVLWIRPALESIGWPAKWADHGAAESVEPVEDWIDRLSWSHSGVFLFINLIEPHWRYLPPCSDRRDLLPEGIGVVEATRVSMKIYGPLLMAGRKVGGPVDAVLRAMYAAAVRYQDRQLTRLVDVIDAKLGENTILVITSDHGENLGEAGRYDHVFAANDHLIHVPLLVRYPPAFPAGKRVAGLCELVDVPVTIAELVPGAKLGEGVTGRSLVPERFVPRPYVVVESDPYFGHFERMASAAGFQRDVGAFAQPLLALRTLERKLVLQGRAAPRLYDVRADRDETNDLLGTDASGAEALLRELEAWRKAIPPYRGNENASAGAPLSPEAIERLRRLGYAGHDD